MEERKDSFKPRGVSIISGSVGEGQVTGLPDNLELEGQRAVSLLL